MNEEHLPPRPPSPPPGPPQLGPQPPSPPSPPHVTKTRARSGPVRPLLVGMAAGLAFVLVAAGGFVGYQHFFGGTDFTAAPSQQRTVDVSGAGDGARLLPLGLDEDPLAASGGGLARFVTPSRSILVALASREDGGQARWMAQVPHSHPAADRAALVEEESGSDAGPALPRLDGVPVDCLLEEQALRCGGERIDLDTGEQTAVADADADATHDEDAAPADPATAAAPLAVSSAGELTHESGTAYPDVRFDPQGPVRMLGPHEEPAAGPWAISDGHVLAVVDAQSLLWQEDLTAAAAAVSGLGSDAVLPGWALADGVLVLGAENEVRGHSAETGEVLWTLEVPGLDSFAVSGGILRTLAGGVLTEFDFSDSSGEERLTAVVPEPGADGALSRADFTDGVYEIPPVCAEFGLMYEEYYIDGGGGGDARGHEAEFADGTADAGELHASVRVDEVLPTHLEGEPAAVVSFYCHAGGSYGYTSLGVYDSQQNLLDSVEAWSDDARGRMDDVPGHSFEPHVHAVSALGPELVFRAERYSVHGDDSCHACEASATAELTYRWDGGAYAHADTVFLTPEGPVRVPATEDVQAFVDAAAAGEDAAAAQWATDPAMELLDQVLGDATVDDPVTVRSAQMEGARVDTCEMIGAHDSSGGWDSDTYYFLNGKQLMNLSSFTDEIRPGDAVCGLTLPGAADEDGADDAGDYYSYLLLRGREDAGVEVYDIGRMFS